MKGILSALGVLLAVASFASPVEIGNNQYFGGPSLANAPGQAIDLATGSPIDSPVGEPRLNQGSTVDLGLSLDSSGAGGQTSAPSPRHVILTPEPVTMTLGFASIGLFLRRRLRSTKR